LRIELFQIHEAISGIHRGGFFLMKKTLGFVVSGYSNRGTAVGVGVSPMLMKAKTDFGASG